MQKVQELSDPNSCFNKATDGEYMFVLLSRDEDAPETIRDWVRRRIARGKNKVGDEQMEEALAIAKNMEAQRAQLLN